MFFACRDHEHAEEAMRKIREAKSGHGNPALRTTRPAAVEAGSPGRPANVRNKHQRTSTIER